MQIALMIEGQDGLNWDRWQRIVGAVESGGFQGLFRSDHFTNGAQPDKDSLELWISLTYLASHSEEIEFGPLVAPVTFRHPSVTARMAAAVSDLSGGRLVLGLGAGWQEREHHVFGVPFPPTSVRYEMLDEYLQVVIHLLRSDEPVTFEGQHYQLHEAVLLPRPRNGCPPILIGGNGERKTMPLAAKYADEWNAIFISPERFRELNAHMDSLLEAAGRAPGDLKRSAMMGTLFARDAGDLREKLSSRGRTLEELQSRGLIAGTPDQWVGQLRAYRDAGLQRVMLQWINQDDVEGIGIVAREVLPHI